MFFNAMPKFIGIIYVRMFVKEGLSNSSYVLCAELVGDHLLAITPTEVNEDILHDQLAEVGN